MFCRVQKISTLTKHCFCYKHYCSKNSRRVIAAKQFIRSKQCLGGGHLLSCTEKNCLVAGTVDTNGRVRDMSWTLSWWDQVQKVSLKTFMTRTSSDSARYLDRSWRTKWKQNLKWEFTLATVVLNSIMYILSWQLSGKKRLQINVLLSVITECHHIQLTKKFVVLSNF